MVASRAAGALARRWRSGLIVLLVAGGLAYGLLLVLRGPAVAIREVVRSDVIQTIVATGRVETPHRIDVGSMIAGIVARVPVDEGQLVVAGQHLVELDDAEVRASVEQASAAVEQAQAKLRQLREVTLPLAVSALGQAEANLLNARQQHTRKLQLARDGAVAQATLDDARRSLDVAEAQVQSARLQVEANRPSGSDVVLAEASLRQVRASLRVAQVKLDYTVIKAPIDGTLIARNVERGDVVQIGRALMVLSPAGETQLVLQVDEKNLSRLALGQDAIGSADAYPSQRFAAVVVYISPAVDPQRGSVEVKLSVPAPPTYLRQDMTVSVDIEVGRRPRALTLSIDAIREVNGDGPWVLRLADGHARRQAVVIGLRGDRLVEIVGGLEIGDRVIPLSAVAISDGSRVRTARP